MHVRFKYVAKISVQKVPKLSGALQINRFFRNYFIYIWNSVFGNLLMDDELGNETYIDVLVVSSALSPPKFNLIEKRRFFYEFSVDKLVFLSFRGYLGEIGWEGKKN